MSATTASPVTFSTSTPLKYTNTSTFIADRGCDNKGLEPDFIINGPSTVVTLFKDVADLIPHKGPLSKVLDLTKEFNRVVNEMYDDANKTSCESLVERILVFLKNLVEDSKLADLPLQDGSPAAAKLFVLLL